MPEAPASAAPAAPASPAAPAASPSPSSQPSAAEPSYGWHGDESQSSSSGEQPAIDTQVEDSQVDDDFGTAEFDAEPEKPAKSFVKDVQEALKDNPQLFKQIKAQHFELNRFREMFKSTDEARKTVDRLESMGGLDAIEQESGEWATAWAGFQAGDPAVLDTWFAENPQGMAKLMPAALNKFRESHPEQWKHQMSSTFMATVSQSGMLQAIEGLYDLPELAESPQAKKLLDRISGVLREINGYATKAPEQDLAPAQKELNQRAEQLKQQENALYQKGVSAQITPLMNKSAEKALNAVLGQRRIAPEARKDLLEDIRGEFARLSKADAEFQRNAKALLASSETDRFMRLCKSNFERNMPLAAKRVWRKYQGISGGPERQQIRQEGQARREAGGSSAPTTAVQHKGELNPKDIDWARMREHFGGRDEADEAFAFGRKFFKKGDKNLYTR